MKNATPEPSAEFKVSGFQRTSILVVCFLLYLINFMDRQVLSAVLEPMKIDLGLTDAQAGILQTAFFLSMAVLGIPASYLVDRWSRRKTMSVVAIVWSVFTYVTGLGRSFIGVLLPRIVVGVGEAGFPAASTAMLSSVYPQKSRGRILGIFNIAVPLGSALGALLGGYLSAHYGGWRTPFYVFAVPGVILGILAYFLKDYKTVIVVDEHGNKTGFGATIVQLCKIPTIRWVYIGYAMHMSMLFSFAAWGGAFIMRAQNVSEAAAGMILGLSAITGIIGTPIGGVFADLWQKKNSKGRSFIPILSTSLAAVVLFLALMLDFKGPGFALVALYGVLAVMAIPAVSSISQDVVSPGLKGVSWGMAGVVTMICGAAWAPSAVGIISDILGGGAYGLKVALMCMCLCGFVSCFCFWRGSRHYPKDVEKVQGYVLECER
ncbi:MAG TPA: MFS transporter [Smithellaceae bacterium]|nr:MFS transporter [Smithellaceae bacterium]HPL66845.1 MFS transporter [Smithellaceae bacterium]